MKESLKQLLTICVAGGGDPRRVQETVARAEGLADRILVVGNVRTDLPPPAVAVSPEEFPGAVGTDWVLFLKPGERIGRISRQGLLALLKEKKVPAYDIYVCDAGILGDLRQYPFILNLGQFEETADAAFVTRLETRLAKKSLAPDLLHAILGGRNLIGQDTLIARGLMIEPATPGENRQTAEDAELEKQLLKGTTYRGPMPGEGLDELSYAYIGFRILHLGYLEGYRECANRGWGIDIMYIPMLEFLGGNGRFADARDLFERWQEKRDGQERRDLQTAGGNIYANLLMIDKAIFHFERANSVMPTAGAFACLAQLHLVRGDRDKSRRALEESLRLQGNPFNEHVLACICSERWRPFTLSLCMIARDEEEHIGRALESVRDIVDEIIVVDTGSADRTQEIARALGARVIDFPWGDDFAAARNRSLEEATGDYILVLDADEFIDATERFSLAVFKKILSPELDTSYHIEIVPEKAPGFLSVSYLDRLTDAESARFQPRLFPRRPDVRFTGKAFESVFPAAQEAGLKSLAIRFLRITHLDTDNEGRTRRKMPAVMKAMEDPVAPSILLEGVMFFLRQGELEAAFPWIMRMKSMDPKLLSRIARLYSREGKIAEAEELIGKGLAGEHDSPELWLALAEVRFIDDQFKEVRDILEPRLQAMTDTLDAGSAAEARYFCGMAFLETDEPARAIDLIAAALQHNGLDTRFQLAGLYAFARLDRWQEFLAAAGRIMRQEEISIEFDIAGFVDVGRLMLLMMRHLAGKKKTAEAATCRKILAHLLKTRISPGEDMNLLEGLIEKTRCSGGAEGVRA